MLQEAVVQPRPSLQSGLNQRYQGVDVGDIGKCGHVETFRSPIKKLKWQPAVNFDARIAVKSPKLHHVTEIKTILIIVVQKLANERYGRF